MSHFMMKFFNNSMAFTKLPNFFKVGVHLVFKIAFDHNISVFVCLCVCVCMRSSGCACVCASMCASGYIGVCMCVCTSGCVWVHVYVSSPKAINN